MQKYLHMSKKSSIFAPEIGKVLNYGLAQLKQKRQRRGATLEG